MSIDPRLADRYQAAAIDPRAVPLDLRWKGVTAATKQLPIDQIGDLVRLAASRHVSQPENRAKFQGYFKEVDPAFLMQGNDQELSVLAAEGLSHALATPSRAADLIGLLVRSSQYSGWAFTIPDLVAEADQYLASRSVAIRRTARPTAALDPKLGGAWKKAAESISAEAAQASQPLVAGWFTKLAGLGLAEGTQVNSALSAVLEFAGRVASTQAEELNILWWLFSEHSEYFDSTWVIAPKPAISLVAALELAGLCAAVPSPIASRAFLSRVIRSAGLKVDATVMPSDAIAKAPVRWRDTVSELKGFGDLTPLVTASVAFDSADDGWIGRAERTSGASLRDTRTHINVGWQMLTELQAVRLAASG